MAYIDSGSVWFCEECGSIVWHSEMDKHKSWHDSLNEQLVEIDPPTEEE